MSEIVNNTPRLMAAASEFNIGKDTLVEFLLAKGFHIESLKSTAKLTEDMYRMLQTEFDNSRLAKEKAQKIDLPRTLIVDKQIYENALAHIKYSLKTKYPYLDLGKLGLTSADFFEGSVLNVELSKCKHLETLNLSNEWSRVSGKSSFIELKWSNNKGHKNIFDSIPSAILQLPKLTTLICCGDTGTKNWNISNIEILSTLKNLEYLDLSENSIFDLKPLSNLTKLTHLSLNNNNIEGLQDIRTLINLEHLEANNNYLQYIDGVENMTRLKSLILQNNYIIDISDFEKLSKLELLVLSKNEIQDFIGLEFLIEHDKEIYLEIDGNPFVKDFQLKLNANENHFPYIKELLMRQTDSSRKRLFTYPLKVLLLGNHSCGKSSLVDFLTNKNTNGSTHILRIEKYSINSTTAEKENLDAILYDFGGQDFYHGLYQAFISKDALQIVLFDSRNDENEISKDITGIPIINFNRKYWLGQKQYQESNGNDYDPYIMVQTYAETNVKEVVSNDYNSYKGYAKSFFLALNKDYIPSQKANEEFFQISKQAFKAYFNSIIKKMQKKTFEPIWYITFLKYILNKNNIDYTHKNFSQVLAKYKVGDLSDIEKVESLKINLITLHRHGLVLYYPQIKELENIVWLNPQKLVEYIQQNIFSKALIESKEKGAGIIAKTDFEKIVNDEKILLLLKEQKVIFLHSPTGNSEQDEYIIPNYLPLIDKNDSEFQLYTFGLNTPNFIIKFNDFIPFGFINQMICFFGKQPDVKKFWRNQLLFTLQKEIRVLIELDFELLKIKIHFHSITSSISNENEIKEYLFFSVLALYWNFKIEEILSYNEYLTYKVRNVSEIDFQLKAKYDIWNSLKYEIHCIPYDAFISLDDQNYISYKDLFNIDETEYKISSYRIENNRININKIHEIPVSSFESFTNKKLARMKKIFISYSKYDEDYLHDFEDHLITLKQEGVITFNCSKIEFGKEWDHEIKKQIRDCDIMVCLVSVKFLNTEYISKIEIQNAIDENKIIVPIIIKSCDWENSTIGKFQAAKRGKIVSLDNNMRLLGQIRGYTEEEKAAFWTDIIKEFRTKLLLP